MNEEYVENITKLRDSLNEANLDNYTKIRRLALLRYYLSKTENEKDKVIYLEEKNDLEVSESLSIAKRVIKLIATELQKKDNGLELEQMQELNKLMKDNFYYLARYLFSYYMIAIEFGIPKEKQFYAPRDMVLGKIARRLDVFYYKPKGVLALNMPQGTGKEQPLSSKILTPTGWITMGDVKVGTKVIGADGKPCNVTGIYPKGIKDVYRVTFKDNSYVDCGLEHLWEVQNRKDRNNKKNPKRVIQLKEMLTDFRIKEGNNWYNNYSVRLVKPVEFENNLTKEDINPYVLGTLIANGSLDGGISFSTASEEVVNKVKKNIFKEDIVTNQSNKYVFGIKRKDDRRTKEGYPIASQTKIKLNEYELYGKKSENKFIPKKYLYSSIQNRIELLRGLMDNDGTVNNKKINTSSQYTTTSEQLCYDVLELVRSLGGKASYSKKESYYKKDNKKIKCKDVYNVYFTLDINPYSIKEKAQYYKKPTYCRNKYIINIEKVRQEECQCIMVDSPEHLYVTDGYTLTHNTELGKRFMSWVVGKNPELPNMMVSYSASIARDKFFNGVSTIIEDENGNYQKIFPKLEQIYRNAETLSLDYADDGRKRPHSEYTLYCAGFDGGITGRTRAHNVLYLDDLVKNMEAANNKDVMDKMNDEFNATLRKRMQGNCKMLIIGTLFSINDPFTRIITYFKENNPKRIEVIRIPRIK